METRGGSTFIKLSLSTKVTMSEALKAKKGGAYDVPWVEKYRPKVLADVVGNEETILRLEAIAEQGNMPNLILSGPPGTGKV
jgi:replication factor C subunit 2/4